MEESGDDLDPWNPYSLEALRELDIKIEAAFRAGLFGPVVRLIDWRNRLVAHRAYLGEARRLLDAEATFDQYLEEQRIARRRFPDC